MATPASASAWLRASSITLPMRVLTFTWSMVRAKLAARAVRSTGSDLAGEATANGSSPRVCASSELSATVAVDSSRANPPVVDSTSEVPPSPYRLNSCMFQRSTAGGANRSPVVTMAAPRPAADRYIAASSIALTPTLHRCCTSIAGTLRPTVPAATYEAVGQMSSPWYHRLPCSSTRKSRDVSPLRDSATVPARTAMSGGAISSPTDSEVYPRVLNRSASSSPALTASRASTVSGSQLPSAARWMSVQRMGPHLRAATNSRIDATM